MVNLSLDHVVIHSSFNHTIKVHTPTTFQQDLNMPQYPHTNSPNWSLYISLKNELREFDNRSRHFLLGDQFINSHNQISWQSMDMVRRKLMLDTLREQSLKCCSNGHLELALQDLYSFELFKFHDFPWLFPRPFHFYPDLRFSYHFPKFSKLS